MADAAVKCLPCRAVALSEGGTRVGKSL